MCHIVCRYNDRKTYWIIIFAIFICFAISLGIFIYYHLIFADYIKALQECANNKDFACMLDANIDKDKFIYNCLLVIAMCLAIIGVFLSSIFTIIYKYRKA